MESETDVSVAMDDPADTIALQAENVSLRDRLMRALAETENTRMRGERHIADARKFAVQNFARELLTVADNLRRAVASVPEKGGDITDAPVRSPLLDGVRATERMLTSALESVGVRRIEALGAPFNPALHEAVLEIVDTSHTPGHVAEVMEDGYTLHARLLRPARVTVAKANTVSATAN